MLIPFNVDVPMQRLPWANWSLILVTCVISVIGFVVEAKHYREIQRLMERPELTPEQEQKIEELIRHPPLPWLSLSRTGFRPWQLVTCTLVHADILHLIGNMIFLFCFGNAMNAKLGHGLFLVLYFVLGAIASLAWLLLSGAGAALLGASGAIMGMVGVFVVFYPRNDVRILFVGMGGMSTFEVMSYWMVAFWMLGDFFGTVVYGAGGVAYIAHLAGEICGIGIGIALVALRALPAERYEENLLQLLGYHKSYKSQYDAMGKPIATKKKRKKRPAADEE
jgi:membrane associated rhomboid family serine protease